MTLSLMTPWFPASTPPDPDRIGYYEVDWADHLPAETEMQMWLGAGWHYVRVDSIPGGGARIVCMKTAFGEHPGDRWRGLTEPAC